MAAVVLFSALAPVILSPVAVRGRGVAAANDLREQRFRGRQGLRLDRGRGYRAGGRLGRRRGSGRRRRRSRRAGRPAPSPIAVDVGPGVGVDDAVDVGAGVGSARAGVSVTAVSEARVTTNAVMSAVVFRIEINFCLS